MRILNNEVDWPIPSWTDSEVEMESVLSQLQEMSFPSEREEDWRYGDIDEVTLEGLKIASLDAKPTIEAATQAGVAGVSALIEPYGEFDNVLVLTNGSPSGVKLSLDSTLEATGNSKRRGDLEGFELVDYGFSQVPLRLHLPSRTTRTIICDLGSQSATLGPRTLEIVVADNAEHEIFEIRLGGAHDSIEVPRTALVIGEGSKVTYTSLQKREMDTKEFAYLNITAGKDSTVNCFHLAVGAKYGRLRTDCDLVGENASAKLLSGYIGGGDQTLEFRTFQNHLAKKTKSELLYKGALAGSSHSIYSGLIHIAKGAVGSDAFQTNRNLVLSDSSHADSVPNLDIQENDVRCSHASAVGPVEDDELYYLACRGIEPGTAERILVRGFFKELLGGHPLEVLEGVIFDSLEEKW